MQDCPHKESNYSPTQYVDKKECQGVTGISEVVAIDVE